MGINVYPAASSGTAIRSFTALAGSTSTTKNFTVSYPAGVYRLVLDDKSMAYSATSYLKPYVSVTDSEGTKTYEYSWGSSTSGTTFINTDRYFYSTGITQISFITYLTYPLYATISTGVLNAAGIEYQSSETNKYVVVGGSDAASSFQYGYSTNGSSWTFSSMATVNTDTRAMGIAYSGGTYYVAAFVNNNTNGVIYSSTDGATWTRYAIGSYVPGNYCTDIAASALGIVAPMYSGDTALNYIYSTNGTTWSNSSFSPGVSSSFPRIAASPTMFVMGLTNRIYYSTNRTVWNVANSNVFTAGSIEYNATPSQKFVAGGSSNSGVPRVYTSTDGITWTARTVGDNTISYGEVKYFNSNWYIFPSSAGNPYSYSTDGITWTAGSILDRGVLNNSFIYDGTRHMILSQQLYASTNLAGVSATNMSAVLEGPFGGTAEQ